MSASICALSFRFDKRITAFAEEKFQRDGIDLKTKSMVVGVTADEISTKERGTGKVVSEPYGMVVWSTGIGLRPFIRDFMQQIGQVGLLFFQNQDFQSSETIYSWSS